MSLTVTAELPGPHLSLREQRGARESVTRLLYLVNGIAALIFCVLAVPAFSAQVWPGSQPVLASVALVLMFGLPLALGVFALRGSLRLLHGLAVAGVVVFVLILVSWLSFPHAPLPIGADMPWILLLNGGPAAALAVSVRARTALAVVLLVSALGAFLRAATTSNLQPVLVGVLNGLQTLLLLSVFIGLTVAFLHSAARVDTAAQLARAFSTGRADRDARTQERLTMNALVHDSVLATLLIAGAGHQPTAVVAAQARTTLDELDALRVPQHDVGYDSLVSGDEAMRRLAALVHELTPDAVLRTLGGPAAHALPASPVRPADGHMVPLTALTALLGSAGEALRNSRDSAGDTAGGTASSPILRTVFLQLTDTGLTVDVNDNGRGFDAARVNPGRLGIAESIVGRMQRLAGGSAKVTSRPGAGTQVALSWRRP